MTTKSILSFAKAHWLPVSALAISFACLVWFAGSIFLNFLYFNDPAHKDQDLKGWMTPRYVSMSYSLPPRIIDQIFNLEPKVEKRRPMHDIAAEMGLSLDQLTDLVRQAAIDHRARKQ